MKTVAPGIRVVPVRTPTLPPATHTNSYVVGDGAMWVFDPASPWPEEQERLAAALQERIDAGERLERIVLTHHHADHVGGAVVLRERFGVPIAAQAWTAAHVGFPVDEVWPDGEARDCGGVTLRAVFTPGHAPGHFVFHDADSGAMIAGDMVAGVGTILISPVDGDLGQYLDSLDRMRGLSPTVLLPAHGDPLHQADAILAFYIAHRHQRSEQIRVGLDELGTATPEELVPIVYADLDPRAHPIAAAQIVSHLRWMKVHGLATERAGRWSS